ncbi:MULTISPECIES: MFS transporter [Clostridium]|uniref:MFS transporter n=1 Tax=Clostridium TaxID=1485 RepID=UPI0008247A8C|nr:MULTISPECIES: MFS transporter [Clostridium]PJI10429.1 MFS transporter [Clostridium sp. CT7]
MKKNVTTNYIKLLYNNSNFKNLWLSRVISYFGDALYNITISWYIFSTTGSAFKVGLVLIAKFLPQVIVGMFLGVLIDKYNKKSLMQLSDITQAIVTLIFAILIAAHAFTYSYIFIINIFLSLAGVLFGTSQSSLLPELVQKDELISANSLLSISQQTANLTGSIIGGVIVSLLGEFFSIFIDSMTFFLSFICIYFIHYKISTSNINEGITLKGMFMDVGEGIYWLKNQIELVLLIVIGMISNIALGVTNVLPSMLIKVNFKGNSSALGIFELSIGLGLLIGGLFIGLISPKRVGKMFLIGLAVESIGMLGIFISPNFAAACTGNFVIGFGVTIFNIPMSTLFQIMIPANIRGRVNSISSIAFSISIPITYGAIGAIADVIGAKVCFAIASLLTAMCLCIGASNKKLVKSSLNSSTYTNA